MEKSFGLLFYLKKPKGFKSGDVPIYMRVTVNTGVAEVSTKQKCDPSKWNATAGRVEGKTQPAKAVNDYLDVVQRKVHEIRKQLLDNDQPVTAENIKTVLQGKKIEEHVYMLMQIFKRHNEQVAELVNHDFAPATLTRYNTCYKHTLSFLQWKYKVIDIDIAKLDYEFISEYEFWLKSVRKCDHNTSMQYLRNFKKIINRCLRNGWLPKNPFIGFKMTNREVERIALTEAELQTIMNKDFATERLRAVRDIFLFSCFSGLSYADVKKLKRSEIFTGVDGAQWLTSRRQKTDTVARVPLLPPAITIMEQYINHPQCTLEDRVLPVLSNQKMNSYLKEIADVCGIHKVLTFHIARHTFATTVTLSNGVPIETVSKLLGHKNLRTTQHYAKILDRKISEDMKGVREKFI
jgi:site-specific recombinase XerD